MIITADDTQFIAFVKAHLSEQFLMSDLGPLRYFLGIEVSSTHDGFYLFSRKIYSGLNIFRAFLIVLLLLITRLLVRLPWSSMFSFLPLTVSLLAILLVIVTSLFLLPLSSTIVTFFVSYIIFVRLCHVTKKQTAVSRLSTEAELRAMALLTAEVTWLQWLFADFGVSVSVPTHLLTDSLGAISIAHDPVKLSLLSIFVLMPITHVHDDVVTLRYVPSELQLADFFTKAQTKAQHSFYLSKLNVPQQQNDYDCGLFVLYYMQRFIQEAPERFLEKDFSMFGRRWFQPEEPSQLRDQIRGLLQSCKEAKPKNELTESCGEAQPKNDAT
ncbi:LOW QUALITY PROTEIN: hypothetical protein U9M48_028485 [Paspalum notatum var. saurae]|uniref:Ubiquitin-like protease family profile domain-containing protein n=1 Tax=Paspalum notatum var. saurae TaxID=547442 RepID=A0AAQ3TWI2_PASNO